MQKITDFIVEKRLLIFILMLILTIASFFMVKYTDINYDIMEYLPKTSNVRIGLDIMNANFKEEVSTLNVMVKDLDEEDKSKALKYLESIKNVSLEYENNKNFNKDNYTLFTLNLDYASSSKEAKKIYQDVTTYFKENLVDTSGTVSDENKVVLPFYIVVIAVLSALVILIIASSSYTEPFLFLFAILVAVFLNKGTNFIFGSVSNITNSIAAILQMALSMDYSIMLMNRYRQEKEKESDKVKAMKNALYYSFKSISSSSVTTIVGLLALVFMSFTIGKDLGFVLAKGVLFSLLSIFTMLPFLILAFDKLITKTHKKSFTIKLDKLGHFAYKFRYIYLVLFLVILVGSYFLKGNLGIFYTSSEVSEVEKYFPVNNQMAIVYEKSLEEEVTTLCNTIKDNKYVNDTLCYGVTIDEPLLYSEVNPKLEELDNDTKIEDYLLKIVYYHYHNPKENNKISLNNFLNFIESNVYKNKKMNSHVSKSMKEDITKLKNFTSTSNINKKRTSEEITNILNINKDTYDDLIILYNTKDNETTLSLNEFSKYTKNNLLTNPKYQDNFNDDVKNELDMLEKFSTKDTINKKVDSDDMAKLFGIDEDTTSQIYLYYLSTKINSYTLSLHNLATFMVNNSTVKSNLSEGDIAKLNNVIKFTDKSIIDKKMSVEELGKLFGIDDGTISQLEISRIINKTEEYTPYEFAKTILSDERMASFSAFPGVKEKLALLETVYTFMDSAMNNKVYTYNEASSMLVIPKDDLKNIYTLYYQDSVRLDPLKFVNLILDTDMLKENLSVEEIDNLTLIKDVMESTNNGKKYSDKELAKFLSLDEEKIKLIYGIYKTDTIKPSFSYKEFVEFLLSDVVPNKEYSSKLSSKDVSDLKNIKKVMDNSLNNKKYTSKEVYNLLKPLSKDLDKDLIDLVYIYYGSVKSYDKKYQMTIEEFITYLYEDILNDKRFADYIDKDMEEDIIKGYDTIKDAKVNLTSDKYNRAVFNTYMEFESEETFAFLDKIEDALKDKGEYYIVGNSAMAKEMNNTFDNELNLITVLTMAFILVVVAFTFKSLKISTMLVLLIQSAIFLIMGILSFGGSVYFISILIVQSILMGATIDYAILYTSYYLEARKDNDIETSLIKAYNNSIHTILTSASILIIVTLIVGYFASEVAAKICKTLSEGTICAAILIIFVLPPMLACLDKFIVKNKLKKSSKSKKSKKVVTAVS